MCSTVLLLSLLFLPPPPLRFLHIPARTTLHPSTFNLLHFFYSFFCYYFCFSFLLPLVSLSLSLSLPPSRFPLAATGRPPAWARALCLNKHGTACCVGSKWNGDDEGRYIYVDTSGGVKEGICASNRVCQGGGGRVGGSCCSLSRSGVFRPRSSSHRQVGYNS